MQSMGGARMGRRPWTIIVWIMADFEVSQVGYFPFQCRIIEYDVLSAMVQELAV